MHLEVNIYLFRAKEVKNEYIYILNEEIQFLDVRIEKKKRNENEINDLRKYLFFTIILCH